MQAAMKKSAYATERDDLQIIIKIIAIGRKARIKDLFSAQGSGGRLVKIDQDSEWLSQADKQ